METLTHLLGTGDAATLAFAIIALAVGALMTVIAVRTRPRRRLR
jgi:tellurite resistance protein TehA-like permease